MHRLRAPAPQKHAVPVGELREGEVLRRHGARHTSGVGLERGAVDGRVELVHEELEVQFRVRVDDVAAVARADQPERRRPDELQSHGSRERDAVDDVAARAAAPDQCGDGRGVTAGHDRGRRAGPERRRRARGEHAEEQAPVREAVRLGAEDLGRAVPRVAVAEQHDVLQS